MFGGLPSSAIFWKSLSRIGVSSSLKFWKNAALKPSGPGLLFAGRFLITVLISVFVMSLANGLSILFILSKNQLLALLILLRSLLFLLHLFLP